MPINIGGDGVVAMTIDGDTVREVTIDGEIAWSPLPDNLMITSGGRIYDFLAGEPIYSVSNDTGDNIIRTDITDQYVSYVTSNNTGVLYDYIGRSKLQTFVPSNGVYYDASIDVTNSYILFTGNDVTEAYDISTNNITFQHSTPWPLGRVTTCDLTDQYAIYTPVTTSDEVYVSDIVNNDISLEYSGVSLNRGAVSISPKYNGVAFGTNDSGRLSVYRTRSDRRIIEIFNNRDVIDLSVGDDITAAVIEDPDNDDFVEKRLVTYTTNTGEFKREILGKNDILRPSRVTTTNNYIIAYMSFDGEYYVFEKGDSGFSPVTSFASLESPEDIHAVEK